jgi:predicted permease
MIARLWRKSVDDEVAEELEFHLEMRIREHIARGLDPEAARAKALRRFGDIERVRAACRDIGKRRESDMQRRETLGELRQDVRFAVRQLAANPGFALIAVLTLALGIGATTAIFSVVDTVVLRPLPFPQPRQLAYVFELFQQEPAFFAVGNYVTLAERQRSFAKLGGAQYYSFNLSATGDSPERTEGARATASYFDVFGLRPLVGRVFTTEEDQPGRDQVVVLSERLWRRRFGADPGVVGRDVRMDGQPYRVIGVMPAQFNLRADREDLWVPIAFTAERKAMHDEHYLKVVGRLRDGVTPAQVRQDLESTAAFLRQSFPRDDENLRLSTEPMLERLVGDYKTRLLVLLGAVGLVLLIACGNVANLLLARSAVRGRELALRAALGAGRGRIIRQLLTESAVLGLLSGILAIGFAWAGVRALLALVPPGVPRFEQAGLDARVLAFALGISLLSSLVFGLAPALRAVGGSLSGSLKEGGRGSAGAARDWLRPALIAGEVALAVLLLVGAGLLIRSALALQEVRPGFEPRGVLTARVSLPENGYREPERILAAFNRLAEEAGRTPGVQVAGLTSLVPMAQDNSSNGLLAEGKPLSRENLVNALLHMANPSSFPALGIKVVRGRPFTDADRRGAQKVAIVSESTAAALFPGQDPIGRRFGCCEGGPDGSQDYKVVVGVAADVRSLGLAENVFPEFYLPMAQAPPDAWRWTQRTMYLVARTDRAPESLAPGLRRAVAAVDPDVPLYDVKTMEQRQGDSIATARFNTLLLTLLGLIGLILAAVGIYGVVSYYVAQRTREIGIRMALGDTPRGVSFLVLRQAALPVAAGLLLGLGASAAATRLLAASLVGVQRTDPLTLATVVVLLATTALLASVVPAQRASRVDPKAALQVG